MHVHANKDVRKVSKNTCIYTFGKVIHGDNSEKVCLSRKWSHLFTFPCTRQKGVWARLSKEFYCCKQLLGLIYKFISGHPWPNCFSISVLYLLKSVVILVDTVYRTILNQSSQFGFAAFLLQKTLLCSCSQLCILFMMTFNDNTQVCCM